MGERLEKLLKLRRECARKIVDICFENKAGHIGSSLSCLDILLEVFFRQKKNEDIFVLSKGHAAAAYYVVLNAAEKVSDTQLGTFYKDGTSLAAHPPCSKKVDEIKFGTGSLGHGLSLANGMLMGAKVKREKLRVFCLLSDGECDEGSVWEAALFSAHQKFSNLIVIVDRNYLQGLGATSDVLQLEPFLDKWNAFGFDVQVCDGHSFEDLNSVFQNWNFDNGRPKCLIAETVKGKSVGYMENNYEWHYWSMSEDQYKDAVRSMEGKK